MNNFGFEQHIARLDKADRLYRVISRFCYTGRAYTPELFEQKKTAVFPHV